MRKKLKDCDDRLAKYRAALEAGTDRPSSDSGSPKVRAERLAIQRDLDAVEPHQQPKLTKAEVKALVAALGDIVTALQDADPAERPRPTMSWAFA